MTTTIYRIEHADGIGMFQPFTYEDRVNVRPHCLDCLGLEDLLFRHWAFNTPQNDGLNFTREHYCAYQSQSQMEAWISPDEFQVLIEAGYKILALRVSDCQVGEYNVIYKKEDVVETADITDYYRELVADY
jgi:hypothetical protein